MKLQSNQNEVVHLNELIRRYEEQSRKQGDSQQYITQYEQQLAIFERDISELNSKLKY